MAASSFTDTVDALFTLAADGRGAVMVIVRGHDPVSLLRRSPLLAAKLALFAGDRDAGTVAYEIAETIARRHNIAGARTVRPDDQRIKGIHEALTSGEWTLDHIDSYEILPYFSGWVRRTRDAIAQYPEWRDWSVHWSARRDHVRAVRRLAQNDRAYLRSVIEQDLLMVRQVSDMIGRETPPSVEGPADCSFFICYARQDEELADRAISVLTLHLCETWQDKTRIVVGDSVRQAIDEGMTANRYGLVLLTRNLIGRPWPAAEIDALLSLATRPEGRLFPIAVDLERKQVRRFDRRLAALITHNDLWLMSGRIGPHWYPAIEAVIDEVLTIDTA
jgi:hypothetical protein